MPDREIHEFVSVMVLGHKYTKVHRWLDGTFNGFNWRVHRIARHHQEAINAKYKVGSGKWMAANLHVIIDWLNSYKVFILPKNAQDVERLLLEHGIVPRQRRRRRRRRKKS